MYKIEKTIKTTFKTHQRDVSDLIVSILYKKDVLKFICGRINFLLRYQWASSPALLQKRRVTGWKAFLSSGPLAQGKDRGWGHFENNLTVTIAGNQKIVS